MSSKRIIKILTNGLMSYPISWRLKSRFISTNRDIRILNSSWTKTKPLLYRGCVHFLNHSGSASTNIFITKEMISKIFTSWWQEALLSFFLSLRMSLTLRLTKEIILAWWISSAQLKKKTSTPTSGIHVSKSSKGSLQFKQRLKQRF